MLCGSGWAVRPKASTGCWFQVSYLTCRLCELPANHPAACPVVQPVDLADDLADDLFGDLFSDLLSEL